LRWPGSYWLAYNGRLSGMNYIAASVMTYIFNRKLKKLEKLDVP